MYIRKLRILILAEIFIFLLTAVSGSLSCNGIPQADTEQLLYGETALQPGIYDVRISYTKSDNAQAYFGVEAEGAAFNSIKSNHVTLSADETEKVCRFYLSDYVENLKVYIKEEPDTEAPLTVNNIEIISYSSSKGRLLVAEICLFSILDMYAIIYLYNRAKRMSVSLKVVTVMLTVTLLCMSVPLFVDYVPYTEGISSVLYAVKKTADHPTEWSNYGNAVLLIPAAFYRMGFSLGAAYRLYLGVCNVTIVLCMYLLFRFFIKDSVYALWGCMLLSLNYYRLDRIYCHPAVNCSISYIMRTLGLYVAAAAIYIIVVKIFLNSRHEGKFRIMAGVISAAVLLAAAYKCDSILRYNEPLWVYSTADLEYAEEYDMQYLIYDTYKFNGR
jgi:hypothetical protein